MQPIGELFKTTDEQVEPLQATVIGDLPEWLSGDLLTIGPGVFDLNDSFCMNHWFDGFGVVCKFTVKDGKVHFSKKYVQSDAYKKAKTVGRPVFTEFGTKAYSDSTKSIFKKMISHVMPDLTDNEANNIYKLGETVYITTESANKRTFNPCTLETGNKVSLTDELGLNLASAHMYFDQDGTGYTMGTSLTTGIKTHIVRVEPEKSTPGAEFKKAKILATLPSRYKTYVSYSHSFGVSDNWIVFVEQPLYMAGLKLVTAHVKGTTLHQTMEWKPEDRNRFVIVNKQTGEIKNVTYEASTPFFFFHHINTYEDNGELIIDLIAHDSPEILDKMWLTQLRKSDFCLEHKGFARRFVLPLVDKIQNVPEGVNLIKTDQRVAAVREGNKIVITGLNMTEGGYDLPTVNGRYYGKKYNYFYAPGLYDPSVYRNSLLKINVKTASVTEWKQSDTSYPGEAMFIPRPGSQEEDDGVLVTPVAETNPDERPFLLVLDARSMKEIGRAIIDSHLPLLLHSLFLPS